MSNKMNKPNVKRGTSIAYWVSIQAQRANRLSKSRGLRKRQKISRKNNR